MEILQCVATVYKVILINIIIECPAFCTDMTQIWDQLGQRILYGYLKQISYKLQEKKRLKKWF